MAPPPDPDDDLLARFAGGDPEAFVTFYHRHLAAVLQFFMRRTGDLRADRRPDGGGVRGRAAVR